MPYWLELRASRAGQGGDAVDGQNCQHVPAQNQYPLHETQSDVEDLVAAPLGGERIGQGGEGVHQQRARRQDDQQRQRRFIQFALPPRFSIDQLCQLAAAINLH